MIRLLLIDDHAGRRALFQHVSSGYSPTGRALVGVVGINHVCLSTDTKLILPYRPAGGPRRATVLGAGQPPRWPARRQKPTGPSGGQNRDRSGARTNQVRENQTVGFFYAVVGAMFQTGFTLDEISKVGGGNFCRVFGAATAGHP